LLHRHLDETEIWADPRVSWHLTAVNPSLVPHLRAARAPSRLDGPCAWAAWLLPLVLGVWTASGDAGWADDLAVLRDLGGVPVGSEGVLSTVSSQLIRLMPVGGQLLRASLLGVIALSACAWLSYGLIRDLLDTHEPFALNPLLALIGSQLWATDPETLADASRLGGPAIPLLVMLAGLHAMRELSDARAFSLVGVLIALAAAENHAAGVVLGVAFGVRVLCAGRRLRPSFVHAWLAGLCGTLALCCGWRVLRPFAALGDIDLGFDTPLALVAPKEAPLDGVLAFTEALSDLWLARLGVVTLLLALAGAVWVSLRSSELRRAVAPWSFIAALGGSLPLSIFASRPQWLELLALASSLGVVVFVPLALRASVGWLWSCRLPFARPASVLAITFAVTVVLQHVDELTLAEPVLPLAAESWTEEALGNVPPRSLVLVQTPALALRLMAARVLRGERPDVIVVPAPFLSSGAFMERLLALEPELSPLLRQLTVHGVADEYSLSRLSDLRPLFVELDAAWDTRLLEHLRPEAMWFSFSPHALGASERREGMARSHAALQRVWHAAPSKDPMTRRALAASASQQAVLLAALGDRRDALRSLRIVSRLEPQDPLVLELGSRIDQTLRGRVAINDLLGSAK
jgi:hypothetical protein